MVKRRKAERSFKFDVCLSFAGQDRAYVRAVAVLLERRGVRVFFDEYEQANLWGRDLYDHLDDIYRNAARYCVLFVSKAYAKSVWTTHERQSAQARALNENAEYVLPVRFDDTPLPGLRPTVAYIDARKTSRSELAGLLAKKLGPRQRFNYLPPVPNKLFKKLGVRSAHDKEIAYRRAEEFVESLGRTTDDERAAILAVLAEGCVAGLPDNVHIKVDLLRRVLKVSAQAAVRTLKGLASLHFLVSVGPSQDHGEEDVVFLEWWDMSIDQSVYGNSTLVAHEMVVVLFETACPHCAGEAFMRLDFSSLASATTTPDAHARQSASSAKRVRRQANG